MSSFLNSRPFHVHGLISSRVADAGNLRDEQPVNRRVQPFRHVDVTLRCRE